MTYIANKTHGGYTPAPPLTQAALQSLLAAELVNATLLFRDDYPQATTETIRNALADAAADAGVDA